MASAGGFRGRGSTRGGRGGRGGGRPRGSGSRSQESSQNERYVSQLAPDYVRYLKSVHCQIQGVGIQYEENQGDKILIMKGTSGHISKAKQELERQVSSLCRQKYRLPQDTLKTFRNVSHSLIIQSLRSAEAWAGWHADLDENVLWICGKEQSVVNNAFSAISHHLGEAVPATPLPPSSPTHIPHSSVSATGMGMTPFSGGAQQGHPNNPMQMAPYPASHVRASIQTSPRFSATPQPTHQGAGAPQSFTDKMEVTQEQLRYLKATKVGRNVSTQYGVEVNFAQSPVEVKGNRIQVSNAIKEINKLLELLDIQSFLKPAVFLNCMRNVQNKEIIGSLIRANVRAGWDIRDKKLWVCSDSNGNVLKAEEAITTLISHGEYPETGGLTDTQRSLLASRRDAWQEMHADLSARYSTLEVDSSRSKISYAVYEKDAKAPLLAAFESFFNPSISRLTSKVRLGAESVQLFKIRCRSLERECQQTNDEPVQLHITGSYCQVESASINSVKYAQSIIRKKLDSSNINSIIVTRPSQCEWIESADGRKRVDEIGKLTKTLPKISKSPGHKKRPSVQTELMNRIELEVGDIAEKANAVDAVFVSQGVIAESVQRLIHSPRKYSKGLQRYLLVSGNYSYMYYTSLPNRSEDPAHIQTPKHEVVKALVTFDGANATTVAIPAVGTGKLNYPPSEVAEMMVKTCKKYLNTNPSSSIQKIYFVIYWHDDTVYQAFKKSIDQRKAVATTQSAFAKVHRNLKITFSGLDKIGVDNAIAKLKADLEAKLSKDDWTSSPLKPGIASLTAQQKERLKSSASQKDVGIQITSDNIIIEGNIDDLKAIRDEINGVLHTITGAVARPPSHWNMSVMRSGYAEVPLDPNRDAPEIKRVMDIFESTCTTPVSVTKIRRIQNEQLYTQYEAQKKKIRNELRTDSVITERSLWHGTDFDTVKKICTNEFNRSYAGRNGTLYGVGSYFATTSQYSLQYARGYMILAKVATGRYYRGSSAIDRTKLKPGYHSTVNDEANPSIFVVYHDAAAYPEYVLQL